MDLSKLTSIVPTQFNLFAILKFLGIVIAAIFILSLLFRLLFGRKSALNKAISASIGVLCIYIFTIIIYTFSPGNLENFLVPLPFVKFSGSYLYLLNFSGADFNLICSQMLSMVILVLLYNLADSILPDGETTSLPTWFLLRCLTIIAAMLIHYFVASLTQSFLPKLLVSYGPTILLLCLVGCMLMGALSVLLGLVLTIVNPIFGLLFTFFFSNKFGKQLSKAMLSTVILTALVAILCSMGYSIISISVSSLLSYVPLLAILMTLWYIIGRKL